MRLKERIYLLNILTKDPYTIFVIPGYDKIRKYDKPTQKTYYENPELLEKMTDKSKIINFNFKDMTIDEIKVLIGKEIVENIADIYLSGYQQSVSPKHLNQLRYREDIFKEPLFKGHIQLGFVYNSEYGTRSLPNNYLKFIDKGIKLNNLDEYLDLGSDILNNYKLKNNTIYVLSRKNVLELKSTKYNDNIDQIMEVYFPKRNQQILNLII